MGTTTSSRCAHMKKRGRPRKEWASPEQMRTSNLFGGGKKGRGRPANGADGSFDRRCKRLSKWNSDDLAHLPWNERRERGDILGCSPRTIERDLAKTRREVTSIKKIFGTET